ncbi:MAG: ParA family protein [Dactylosporangium sp.]|nr:ParA family protein [Dactylosporangium sp.]NNJ63504.1 ParA family protein [Dactylosporangium sp.]
MALIVMVSAKGSPGVTCTGLACTLSWERRMVLAECDPSGGSLLGGYLQGQVPGERGMLPLAMAELRSDRLADEFWVQLIDLDAPRRERLLLPGITDPAQVGSLSPLWDRFAAHFVGLERADYDVIADCGRLITSTPPWPIVWAADAVLLVIRPTLPSIAAAAPAAAVLAQQLTDHTASTSALGLLVVGEGPYDARQAAHQLRMPLVGHLPEDSATARVLSFGGSLRLSWPLMRATAGIEARVRAVVARHRQEVPPHAMGARQVRRAV